jgi:Flp pilus assembly protein TadD
MRQQLRSARLLASAALTVVLATGLGGCQTMSDITGSITPSSKSEPAPDADPQRLEQALGDRYRANPKDAEAALAYGLALRANGQRAQAAAVLEQASIANPGNKSLLAAYGRALADNGNFQQAFDVLTRAHSPANPDWRILSVQGTCLDQMGRHDEARRYYESALKIVPNEPSVLSNLGLSYMLSKDLPKAEQVLRQAYANPKADSRVRQNLGLVVGLQGRFAEAETIVKADLPPDEAAANVSYLREMLKGSSESRTTARNGSVPLADLNRPD